MSTTQFCIFERDYYALKKQHLDAHYEIAYLVSLHKELVGLNIEGKPIISIEDFVANTSEKTVILAIPISALYCQAINLLFKLGIGPQNIVTLLNVPNYYGNENIALLAKNVCYDIYPTGEVVCNVDGHKFVIETNNDLYIVKEIFGQKVYDFYLPDEHVTIVDIGMNIGVASIFFRNMPNVVNVYGFEPFKKTYECALKNFALNNIHDRLHPRQVGLGDSDKTIEVQYNESLKGLMSTSRSNAEYLGAAAETVVVETVDATVVLTSVIEENPGNAIVAKIDCEGAEYEILSRLDATNMINKIKLFIMEWHNYEGKNILLLEDIFKRNGFIYYIIGARCNEVGMMIAVNTGI
ncbi:hypothetical protein GURASL_33510 [Geotalea uraniireducens]|uniref:Methyltransferase FkbM domain-containing protein n=1 Tax=Geotalea uraniireducens TaxID=351604 RepID=A0ABM8EP98_9BACT|nr:FkbM family methyltransferase [Geotalea uraniireducens]BDV44428.1 hypothetical protein GURASL_33510 [Geotalea uraniireducens]